MLTWLRSLFRRPDPPADFHSRQTELLAEWFRTAAASGKPKGLTWVKCEPIGEPIFGHGWAVLTTMVQFEPVADGPLADVPQAREPRQVIAVFTYTRRRWSTTGRAVFNLSITQVAEQLGRPQVAGGK